jgi:GntR family transcriptional repressor for pyruvate dehydrogenase complex
MARGVAGVALAHAERAANKRPGRGASSRALQENESSASGHINARVDLPLADNSTRAAPSDKVSAPEMAVRAIQDLIRRNALKPGERLPAQRELSNELNVSRTSLREALSTLEALGIVSTSAGRGTFVTDAAVGEQAAISSWRFSNRYELHEVYEYRYLMESAAVRLAAMNISEEELTELKLLHAQYKAKLTASDFMASAVFDFQFHRSIMVCSRNRVFVDIYDKFHKIFQQTQMLPFSRRQRRWEAVIEHGKILEALQQHDPDGAAFFLEMHLLRATQRIGIRLNLPK